jgi:hypothetical protein
MPLKPQKRKGISTRKKQKIRKGIGRKPAKKRTSQPQVKRTLVYVSYYRLMRKRGRAVTWAEVMRLPYRDVRVAVKRLKKLDQAESRRKAANPKQRVKSGKTRKRIPDKKRKRTVIHLKKKKKRSADVPVQQFTYVPTWTPTDNVSTPVWQNSTSTDNVSTPVWQNSTSTDNVSTPVWQSSTTTDDASTPVWQSSTSTDNVSTPVWQNSTTSLSSPVWEDVNVPAPLSYEIKSTSTETEKINEIFVEDISSAFDPGLWNMVVDELPDNYQIPDPVFSESLAKAQEVVIQPDQWEGDVSSNVEVNQSVEQGQEENAGSGDWDASDSDVRQRD